jgi:O-methyltransferase
MIKTAINNLLKRFDIKIIRPSSYELLPKSKLTFSHDLLFTYHNADFLQDKRFMESYNLGKDTDVNKSVLNNYDIFWRIHVLCWAATNAKNLEGDFVDCGVNTGIFSRAVINYIDFNSTNKKYYLLDTFNGLDERYSTKEELHQSLNDKYRSQSNTYENVKNTFKDFNVEIIKGSVPETLELVKSSKVCYLSIDMNCVQPEVDALNFFWDKLVVGGIIILDDYGYGNITNSQKAAHDDFAKSKGIEILSLPTGQGLILKSKP